MPIYRLVGLFMSMLQVPVVGLLKQSFQTDGRRGPGILIDELQGPAGWYSNRRTPADPVFKYSKWTPEIRFSDTVDGLQEPAFLWDLQEQSSK
jgi:hypothetical protein